MEKLRTPNKEAAKVFGLEEKYSLVWERCIDIDHSRMFNCGFGLVDHRNNCFQKEKGSLIYENSQYIKRGDRRAVAFEMIMDIFLHKR